MKTTFLASTLAIAVLAHIAPAQAALRNVSTGLQTTPSNQTDDEDSESANMRVTMTTNKEPLTAEKLQSLKQEIDKKEQDMRAGRGDPGITPEMIDILRKLWAQKQAEVAKTAGNAVLGVNPNK